MDSSDEGLEDAERLNTGVPGLDTVLNGGLLKREMYLLRGPSGSGKTILANQLCFNFVQSGEQAIYITLLTESHGRMLHHLRSFDYFKLEAVGRKINYLSGYGVMENEGLKGLLELIRKELMGRKACLVVLDGLTTVEDFAGSPRVFKKFLHDLRSTLDATGSTGILLASAEHGSVHPESTIVDGIIVLSYTNVGLRAVRELQVAKMRGSRFVEGSHQFTITRAGVELFPRTEGLLAIPSSIPQEKPARLPFGIASLDTMLYGGLLSGSTTLLLGAPGTGKTLLGLNFLSKGAAMGEHALYFGFYETIPRLIGKAAGVGFHLGPYVEQGVLELLWNSPVEQLLDEVALRLLQAVRRRPVRRLFIDGVDGFRNAAVYPERVTSFFTALMNELKAFDVTTLVSQELPLFVPTIEVAIGGVSASVENIICLRYVELHSQLHRSLSIMKVRESDYDFNIRELMISDKGLALGEAFPEARSILSGLGQSNFPESAVAGLERPPRKRGGPES